jgi:iron complex outermembrane recepter protein
MHRKTLATAIALALVGVQAHADDDTQQPDSHHTELESVVVTALPLNRTKLDSAQPVDILAGEKLDDRRGMTLGETLAREPGVHATAYGAGASRPIIRGLSGPRVRVLEDGLFTADTAAQSDDHAVTVDPLLIDRIEILRGPATLLYGSGAVGGVVNIVDGRIPESVPDRPFEGRFEARGDSVADERSGALQLRGGGGNLAWYVDGSWRDADDYRIPGEARLHDDDHHDDHADDHDDDHHDDDHGGRLENSFAESQSGTLGLSWIGQRGFVGASFRAFDTEYGIPAPHMHGDDHDDHEDDHGHDDHGDDDHDDHDEEMAFIDMKQRRWDLKAGLNDPLPRFSQATLRMSYNDYRHLEMPVEGHHDDEDDHGHDHDHDEFTRFEQQTFQTRLQLEHEPMGGWRGVLGMQLENEQLKADGEEAFIPDGETRSIGLFLLEEKQFGDVTLSFGGRVERTRVRVDDHHDDDDDDHDHDHDHHEDDHYDDEVDQRLFTAWSLSTGAVWRMSDLWQSSLNVSHSERAPSHGELFADGPHLATFSFERGNARLSKETTRGIDLGLHRHSERFDFELNLFYKQVDDYIFLEDTGETRLGLPVRHFDQSDADFYGFEVQAVYHVGNTGIGHIDLRAQGDLVRGKLDFGENLPRISPTRVGVGADWYLGGWRSSVDLTRSLSQSRVASFESETSSYTMLDLSLAYSFDLGDMQFEAFAQGRNLLDEEARVHTSYLKEFAPLPGRNFRFGIRGRF